MEPDRRNTAVRWPGPPGGGPNIAILEKGTLGSGANIAILEHFQKRNKLYNQNNCQKL